MVNLDTKTRTAAPADPRVRDVGHSRTNHARRDYSGHLRPCVALHAGAHRAETCHGRAVTRQGRWWIAQGHEPTRAKDGGGIGTRPEPSSSTPPPGI